MGARALLAAALALLLSAGVAACQAGDSGPGGRAEQAAPYDWLIRGGDVIDGTGASERAADLLLRDGLVAHIGSVDPDTLDVTNRFDASGLVVAPGFIDAHAHGDPLAAARSRGAAEPGGPGAPFANFLAQGVTTVILGQDGSSPQASAMAGHLDAVEAAGPPLNVAYLVGHNTLRSESGVGFSGPGPSGLERMANLVVEAMDAGALGLSTGLEYTPGNRADMEELVALAEPVAARGGVVTSHLRSEDADRVMAAVEELLEQGRRSGAAVHVSHIKVVLGDDPAQARRILDRLSDARASGTRATADVYPYLASFTGISILFPDWARGPTPYAEVVRERRAELAGYLRDRVESRNGPEATLFGSGTLGPGAAGPRALAGRTLAEVAGAEGRPFEQILIDLGPSGARAAYFVMDEDVLSAFVADPWVAVSSDGSPGMSHPRGYGSFARILRRYVAEEGLLGLEDAVRKMTALPASIFGLDDPDRVEAPAGLLREGWAGDVVVFDPDGIRDRATFAEPHLLAEGVAGVWVNGALAWTAPGSGGAELAAGVGITARGEIVGGPGRVIRRR